MSANDRIMGANSRQEGGTHYKLEDKKQHWDLVVDYNWDYFQSQITKYLMRWKTKHPTRDKRLEDLKKARHFLDKYIENFDAYDAADDVTLDEILKTTKVYEPKPHGDPVPFTTADDGLIRYEKEHTAYVSDSYFLCEGGSGNGANMYTCRKCKVQMWAINLREMHHIHMCTMMPDKAAEPTGAYVNQGRD